MAYKIEALKALVMLNKSKESDIIVLSMQAFVRHCMTLMSYNVLGKTKKAPDIISRAFQSRK